MFVEQLKNTILYEYVARILKYVCVCWSGERHARAAGERTVSRRLEQRDLASHPQRAVHAADVLRDQGSGHRGSVRG